MKNLILISVVLCVLYGCKAQDGQSPRPDPLVDAIAPVAVSVFVPEPWRSLILLLMGGLGKTGIDRVRKK